jgi:hypothetical protein
MSTSFALPDHLLLRGNPSPPRVRVSGLPPRGEADGSLRSRLWMSLPLFAASAGFLAGAWVASNDHIRVLSSPFPLWIVLALNAAVAAIVGAAATILTEPDPTVDDDEQMIRVPRVQWESMQRRLVAAHRRDELRSPAVEIHPPAVVTIQVVPRASLAPCPEARPPSIPLPGGHPLWSIPEIHNTVLPCESERLECHGIASDALFPHEHHGMGAPSSGNQIDRLVRVLGP